MITVIGANASPFVRKVRVFLAEKGVDYTLEPLFPFGPNPEFRKISPLGKIPVLRDGDKVVNDSSVICAYLERTHPSPALYPTDPYEYSRALWFEEYGDGGMAPVIGGKVFFPRVVGPRFMGRQPDEAAIKKSLEEEVPPLFDYLESQLTGDYFVGNKLSVGDLGIATQFVNFRHAGEKVDAKRWPKLAGFVDRMHARPSFQAVIAEEEAQFKS
jgi:glutathione S-transferase